MFRIPTARIMSTHRRICMPAQQAHSHMHRPRASNLSSSHELLLLLPLPQTTLHSHCCSIIQFQSTYCSLHITQITPLAIGSVCLIIIFI